jgi:hypothetical protein
VTALMANVCAMCAWAGTDEPAARSSVLAETRSGASNCEIFTTYRRNALDLEGRSEGRSKGAHEVMAPRRVPFLSRGTIAPHTDTRNASPAWHLGQRPRAASMVGYAVSVLAPSRNA